MPNSAKRNQSGTMTTRIRAIGVGSFRSIGSQVTGMLAEAQANLMNFHRMFLTLTPQSHCCSPSNGSDHRLIHESSKTRMFLYVPKYSADGQLFTIQQSRAPHQI